MKGEGTEDRESENLVASNYQIMTTEMPELLLTESMGGSHLVFEGKKYPTLIANALVDVENGQIVAFGNNLQPSETNSEIAFHVIAAIDSKSLARYFETCTPDEKARKEQKMEDNNGRDLFIHKVAGIEKLSEFGQSILNRSVSEYNTNFFRKISFDREA